MYFSNGKKGSREQCFRGYNFGPWAMSSNVHNKVALYTENYDLFALIHLQIICDKCEKMSRIITIVC